MTPHPPGDPGAAPSVEDRARLGAEMLNALRMTADSDTEHVGPGDTPWTADIVLGMPKGFYRNVMSLVDWHLAALASRPPVQQPATGSAGVRGVWLEAVVEALQDRIRAHYSTFTATVDMDAYTKSMHAMNEAQACIAAIQALPVPPARGEEGGRWTAEAPSVPGHYLHIDAHAFELHRDYPGSAPAPIERASAYEIVMGASGPIARHNSGGRVHEYEVAKAFGQGVWLGPLPVPVLPLAAKE